MFIPIKTERLLIRPLRSDDIPSIFSYRSKPEVSRFQNWVPETIEDAKDFIEPLLRIQMPTPGMWFQLGICLSHSEELIGDCGIHLLESAPRHAEIGMSLDPKYQKQGYAIEAFNSILSYLFKQLDIHRVIGSVDPRNSSSVSLSKRVGMRQEAHFIQSYWSKGEWTDDLVFALLKSEWSE